MKLKKYYIVTLLLLVLLPVTFLRFENIVLQPKENFKTKAELNVRSGPGTQYPVLYKLERDVEVEVLSKENEWYKIYHFGKIGFVNSKYIIVNSTEAKIENSLTESIKGFINIFLIIAYMLLAVFIFKIIMEKISNNRKVTKIPSHSRGTESERDLVNRLINIGIPTQNIFHDLLIEKYKGTFAQVDVVALTEVGLLVFEVKDYSGWIYGRGDESSWTKELNNGKVKYRFYNPILQNKKHIAEIKKLHIEFYEIPIFSIIVFYGECSIREIQFVPKDTFLAKVDKLNTVLSRIFSENKKIKYNRLNALLNELQKAERNGRIAENQKKHSANIKDMLGEDRVYD